MALRRKGFELFDTRSTLPSGHIRSQIQTADQADGNLRDDFCQYPSSLSGEIRSTDDAEPSKTTQSYTTLEMYERLRRESWQKEAKVTVSEEMWDQAWKSLCIGEITAGKKLFLYNRNPEI